MNRNRLLSPRVLAPVAALLSSVALAGCADREYSPIRVPQNAEYLGMNGGGKSFRLPEARDAVDVDCGASKIDYPLFIEDINDFIRKEVQLLPNGMAQVTCYGSGEENFPVERFDANPAQHGQP